MNIMKAIIFILFSINFIVISLVLMENNNIEELYPINPNKLTIEKGNAIIVQKFVKKKAKRI